MLIAGNTTPNGRWTLAGRSEARPKDGSEVRQHNRMAQADAKGAGTGSERGADCPGASGRNVLPKYWNIPRRNYRQPQWFTPREVEVAKLIFAGQGLEEIAQTLNISKNTVKAHARWIYQLLGVGSRKEMLVKYAFAVQD